MALYWQTGDPTHLWANCDRVIAERLIRFDHHRVVVNDRWGILLTYHLADGVPEQPVLKFLLHPAPGHTTNEDHVRAIVKKHPEAPRSIQAIVAQLNFRPLSP